MHLEEHRSELAKVNRLLSAQAPRLRSLPFHIATL
jgi:hypothetical protein